MHANLPAFISHEQIMAADLPLEACFHAVETALLEHARGAVEMPPKVGVHPAERSFLHAMPAYIPAMQACGVKWVGGYPENTRQNLPMISGLVVLNDPATGLPRAILDARWITAMRTAVVSALLARCCAATQARAMGLAGCGVQGAYHLRCVCHVKPELNEIFLYDIASDRAEALKREAAAYTSAKITVVDSAEVCLKGRTLCVTCTSGNVLEAQDDWLPPGGTAVGVDSHVAWTQLFQRIDKFILDDEVQCRAFERVGKYRGPLPTVYAQLGEILAGSRPGRECDDERILGLPLGLAITDIALAQALFAHIAR